MGKAGDFYTRFQRLCQGQGRSATSVVKSCGLSTCLVTAWKNGASPTIATVARLTKELGVSVTALLPDDT